MPNAAMILDSDLRFVEANDAYCQAVQRTREQLLGNQIFDVFPDTEERMRQRDLHGGDGDNGDNDQFEEDEAWAETKFLMNTIDDVELTDIEVEPEKLLFRLFHEHGVRVFEPTLVRDNCSCSEQKVTDMLAGLSADERSDSVEDGEIRVTCEFCSQDYSFDPAVFS